MRKGFTLVELLVIVSLITVLSVVGLVLFQSARGKATEAKYKGDIDAIKKAYEKNFDPSLNNGQGGYKVLSTSDFAGGKIPTPDGTTSTSYNFVYAPASSPAPAFKVCSSLNSQTACSSPSTNCHCVTSTQGDNTIIQTLNSTNHPASCDPNGTLNTGLVGYWKFNETSGIIVADIVNSNTGTWNGTLGTQWIAGKFGNAGSFNGTNNYVTAGDPASGVLDFGTGSMTSSVWVKTTQVPVNYTAFVDKKQGGSNNAGYNLNLSPASRVYFRIANGTTQFSNNESASVINDGFWHLITGVLLRGTPNDTLSTYVDGVFERESTTPTGWNIDSTLPLEFGRITGTSTLSYTGQLDDIRIYNRALSASEISSLYYGGAGCVP